MRDLVIVGGGPVGLAAALFAARAGLDVVVHEPRPGPIDKACGEGLMPGAVAALDRLGVTPAGRRFDGIRYRDDRHLAEARFRHGPGLGVRRTALHAALQQRATDTGIAIDTHAVRTLEQRADHVCVDGGRARYVLAADGLHSPTRTLLGVDRPPGGPRRFGLRTHIQLAPWSSFVEVHWAPGSEAYVTPVAEDLIGVALLSHRRAPFDALLAEHHNLLARISGAARSRVLGAGPLRQRAHRRVVGRVLLVGDASGYVDALTGEGIALGIAQAEAAVDAIAAGIPERYERAWRRIGRRHRILTQLLLTASGSRTARARIVPAAARLPALFERAVNELARP